MPGWQAAVPRPPAWRRDALASRALKTGTTPSAVHRRNVWDVAEAACFWAYLAVLTTATHVPNVDPAYLAPVRRLGPLQPDKTLHLIAYGLLGALAGVAFARRMTPAARIRLFVVLACWGFFDEFTQPLFARSADVVDWCFDVTGLAIGLSCALAWHHWRETAGRGHGGDVGTPESSS